MSKMEVVLYSYGEPEKLIINGIETIFVPGKPTVVPDDIGERLLEKSNYLTVKQYEDWKKQRAAKAKAHQEEIEAKKAKKSKKKKEGDK